MLAGGILLFLYLGAILGTPPVDPLTAEKMEIIRAQINECLEDRDLTREDMSREVLLGCIQDKLREKGIFNVTYFHAKMYLEEFANADQ